MGKEIKLLYKRVLLKQIKDETYAEEGAGSVIKHTWSNDGRIQKLSKGKVMFVGADCELVSVGDIVAYKTNFGTPVVFDHQDLVQLNEDMIEGIWEE